MLDFASGLHKFGNTTIEDLLRHHSGWVAEDLSKAPWMPSGIAAVAEAGDGIIRNGVPLPGDLHTYLAQAPPQTLYEAAPGTKQRYHGQTFRFLGEIFSHSAVAKTWSNYESELQRFLGLPVDEAHLAMATQREALKRGEFPVQLTSVAPPGTGSYEPGYLPFQYSGMDDFAGPAGNWTMSAETLVGIYQRLAAHASTGGPLLPTYVVQRIPTPPPLHPSSWGLGHQYFEAAYHPEAPGSTLNNKTVIWWDGLVTGGTSILAHYLPLTPDVSTGELKDNLTIAMLCNTISGARLISTEDVQNIARIAEAVEHAGGFA